MAITRMIKTMGRNKTAPLAAAGRVALDYPQQGETITAPQYTFRAGAAGDVERVEISINQGPWQACRYSVGYWWYDWAGYTAGPYQAELKARMKNGTSLAAGPVKFRVAPGANVNQ